MDGSCRCALGNEFGDRFRLMESSLELHGTPSGAVSLLLVLSELATRVR